MKKGLLIFTMLAIGCSSSLEGPYYESNMPNLTIQTNANEDNIVFRLFSDKDLRTLIRESVGNGSITFEIPEGKYYFSAWKDRNGNGTLDAGDLYGVDTTGFSVGSRCYYKGECVVYITLRTY